MNDTKITQAFADLTNHYVIPQMDTIYQEIYKEARNCSPEILASKITTLESRSINRFSAMLDEQAGEVAAEAMKSMGIQEVRIPMIWVKARKAVKAPHVQLCNQQQYSIPTSSTPAALAHTSAPPRVGKYILGIGAVVEVLSWVFLPSGKLWVAIVKGFGILMMGLGAYQIAREAKATPRITLTEEAKKAIKAESEKAIRQICQQQCTLNTDIFARWLNDLSDQLIQECTTQI